MRRLTSSSPEENWIRFSREGGGKISTRNIPKLAACGHSLVRVTTPRGTKPSSLSATDAENSAVRGISIFLLSKTVNGKSRTGSCFGFRSLGDLPESHPINLRNHTLALIERSALPHHR